jgi:MoaA/NifB/PqqE/SkfB family radical SAM enzyme
MYKLKKLDVFLEISTFCNAGCPQCHRTNPNGLDKADWLPLVNWSIEQFKKVYPPHKMYLYKQMDICGSWGDPVMNKDIFEIIEYITSHGVWVNMSTNGSIRDEEWWFNLGVIGGHRLAVQFCIDGSTQEMHELYRRKTDLQKILNNMESFSQTRAQPKVFTVRFKHSEPYLKDIQELSKAYGAHKWTGILSNRFQFDTGGKVFPYTYNGKQYRLEEVEDKSEPLLKVRFKDWNKKKKVWVHRDAAEGNRRKADGQGDQGRKELVRYQHRAQYLDKERLK